MTKPDTSTSEELTQDEMLDLLRLEIKSAKSVYAWARANGLVEDEVYPILKGKRLMAPNVARVLGYEPVRKWVKS